MLRHVRQFLLMLPAGPGADGSRCSVGAVANFSGESCRIIKVTNHLHLVPRLGMNEVHMFILGSGTMYLLFPTV
jgi:hypothetical protein